MILVDASIWADHLRAGNAALERLLERGEVLGHPWIVGELALGHLRGRNQVLHLLTLLPQAVVADPTELLMFIEERRLSGVGIGYVDVQLLAATLLTPGALLWTTDKRLADAAAQLAVLADPSAQAPE